MYASALRHTSSSSADKMPELLSEERAPCHRADFSACLHCGFIELNEITP